VSDHLGVTAVRWLLAALLVAALPLASDVPLSERLAFGYGLAFVWVPVTGLLVSARRRRATRSLTALAIAVDLAPFVLALWLLPTLQILAVPGAMILVWYWVQAAGPGASTAAAAVVASALVLAATTAGGPVLASASHALALTVILAGVLWLSRAAVAGKSVADREAARMADRSGALLTGVAEAIVITSPHGRIREWNLAAERTFAVPRTQARGGLCSEVLELRHGLRELDCSSGCALVALAEESGQPDLEVWRPLGDGRRQPLLAHVADVRSDDGTVLDVVHSLRDVTRLKEAEEAKTMFLATASHELKTPLTVIEGFAELLARHPDPDAPEFRVALDTIVARSADLKRLVERLLLSSRIDAGKVDLVREPLDVAAIVAVRAQEVARSREHELVLRVADDLPHALAEPHAVETIIDHLVENAVKYSPDGGKLDVEVDRDDTHVVLSVADHGVGMTPEEAARCFDRFWQADGSDTRRFGGSGIGLYVVRSIVDALGGSIEVASELGVGSRFTVCLPRADVAPRPPEQPDDEVASRAPEPSIIREFMRQVGVSSTLGGPL